MKAVFTIASLLNLLLGYLEPDQIAFDQFLAEYLYLSLIVVCSSVRPAMVTRATRVTRGIWDSFYVHSTLHQVKTIFHLTIKTYFFVNMDSVLHRNSLHYVRFI